MGLRGSEGGDGVPVVSCAMHDSGKALRLCLQGPTVTLVIGFFCGVVGQACQNHGTDIGVVHDDGTLGLAAHSNDQPTDPQHAGLVMRSIFEVHATEEDIRTEVQSSSFLLSQSLDHVLVQGTGRFCEGLGRESFVPPRGEAVDHDNLTSPEFRQESPYRSGEQELLDAELDQHLDLQPDHETHGRVERVLVHVDPASQHDDARGLAVDLHQPQLQTSFMPLQFIELAEGTDLVEGDGVRGRERECVTPARAQHDGKGDRFFWAEFQAMAQFTLTLLKHSS